MANKHDDGPTAEQAKLEAEMQKKTPAGATPIGSDFEKLERKFREEAAQARETADELVLNADEAQRKADAARAKIAELNASEEMRYTYKLYSRSEFTMAIKIDDTKRRLHLAFVYYQLTINRPFMQIVKDKFGFDLTPAELIDILKKHPGNGFDFIITGPGIKLTPEQEAFARSTVARAHRRGDIAVAGPRATGNGRT
ncbi:MAG: hypothetical protein ABIH23_14520 [bacterium]